METVRTAAAQAGYVDTEQLIFDSARAFHEAKTAEELDAAWKAHVTPVYGQLSEATLSILGQLHALNAMVLRIRGAA